MDLPSTSASIDWWEQLDDPFLENLVRQMLEGNLQLKEAAERIEQSVQKVSIQSGGRYPAITMDGGKVRSFAPSPSGNGDRNYSEQYTLGISAGWQADVFGRVRKSVELAENSLLATEADRIAIEQILIAELARARLSAATNSKLLELASLNLENRKDFV